MKYVIYPGKQEAPVFVLLHGTGGTETSLIELGKDLNPEATLIGIRGDILENGYPRFFRRLEEGVFDEEDLAKRGVSLHQFIQSLALEHSFDLEKVILIGYSNGANIGINLLLNYSEHYKKAILFHPMYPVKDLPEASLNDTEIFATMGRMDPIVSVAESNQVLELFRSRGAEVVEEWTQSHQLTYLEVSRAKEWLEK